MGVHPATLRTWESAGLLHPTRDKAGHRLYTPTTIRDAEITRQLRRGGHPLPTSRPSSPPSTKQAPPPPYAPSSTPGKPASPPAAAPSSPPPPNSTPTSPSGPTRPRFPANDRLIPELPHAFQVRHRLHVLSRVTGVLRQERHGLFSQAHRLLVLTYRLIASAEVCRAIATANGRSSPMTSSADLAANRATRW
ncbi:MerR family transcriptional regulator [Actinokineospora soli]|uniref:MerR family transcriptional regulator n=1 Tax=Actinokineospora soli TaxID=1048753 RepID=A0ABW2TVK5_9PSEU